MVKEDVWISMIIDNVLKHYMNVCLLPVPWCFHPDVG